MANNEIFETNVPIEPKGVIYNIEGSQVATFVYNLLTDAGIDGVLMPQVALTREGSNIQAVTCVAFFRSNSPDAVGVNVKNSNNMFIRNIVGPGRGAKPSERLEKVLKPLVKGTQDGPDTNLTLVTSKGKSYLTIKLDIFRVLSLMLKAPRRKYEIIILSSYNIANNRDCILQVIKNTLPPESVGNDEQGALRNIAMELARGRR